MLGDWFGTIAAIILVNRYTDSGLAISVLFLARGLPSFLFAPIVGVAADRFNRRRLLVTTDILQTLVGLSFLLVVQFESVVALYVVTTLQFTLAAFFEPARAAILPNLVHNDANLLIANTLTSTTWSVMLAIGAAIGGLTTAVFGVETAIVVNSLTFLTSAFLIYQIEHIDKQADDEAIPTSGYLDFVDGLRYVLQRPNIGLYTTVKGMSQIGSIDTLFTLYAAGVFVVGTEGSVTLGVLYMSFGLGAIAGPVLGNYLGDGSASFFRRWIGFGFLMIPIGWTAFSVAPALLLAAVAIFVRAMGNSINWTYSNVQIQLKTPDRYMGRVFALDFSIFTLAYTVAVVLTGFLDDAVGLSPREIAFVFGAAGIIPTALWVLASRYLATFDGTERETYRPQTSVGKP